MICENHLTHQQVCCLTDDGLERWLRLLIVKVALHQMIVKQFVRICGLLIIKRGKHFSIKII